MTRDATGKNVADDVVAVDVVLAEVAVASFFFAPLKMYAVLL